MREDRRHDRFVVEAPLAGLVRDGNVRAGCHGTLRPVGRIPDNLAAGLTHDRPGGVVRLGARARRMRLVRLARPSGLAGIRGRARVCAGARPVAPGGARTARRGRSD
jgi:hypothetical protein